MQKKVSMWPLYAADALMFLAVFFMALPNIFLKEPLETGQAFALALVVLVAMCLVILPHFFAYRLEIDAAKIAEQKKRDSFAEEIRQIFADLRTLRDSLMEQIKFAEKTSGEVETLQIALRNLRAEIEKFAEKISAQASENSKTKADLSAALSALETLKAALADFEKKSSAENGDHLKYLSDKLEKLSAESASKFEILDDICSQLQALGDAFAESEEDEEGDESEDDAEELDEETEEDAEAETDDEAESEESEESEEEELIAETETPATDETEPNEDSEEQPAEDSAEAEEELSETETEEDFGNDDDYEDLESEESEDGEAGEEGEDSESEESEAETEASGGAGAAEAPADPAPKGNPKWEGMLDKALQNSQAFSTRETVSKFIEKNKAEAPEAGGQANLFDADELPQAHKPVLARSGDTAVVVNAFLGIGNVPYIRGYGAGLSPEKGVPMDLLEIGKYQWKCEALIAEPIKISIWLNDETPSNLGELTLNPNETLDVEPSF